MKKYYAALLAAIMAAGCAQTSPAAPAETASPEATAEATAAPEETAQPAETALTEMTGAWTVNTDFNAQLADNDKTRFETALEGFVGVGYTPIQVIAEQVVNGTNYAYLVMSQAVTANALSNYHIMVINETPANEVSLVNIKKIEVSDIKTKAAAETLLGGWQATGTGKAGMLPGEAAQASFDEACKSLEEGLILNPIALLGTQVAAGTNYAALCRGRFDGEDEYTLYITKWFNGIDGKTQMLSNELFDLEYYTTPSIEGEPIVGEWELTEVEAAKPGETLQFMEPETNASLYGDPAYYVFNEDGTASLNIIEGDHTEEIKGNWKVDAGVYTFTVFESEELSVVYDPLTDTLVRVIQDNAPDAQYSMVQFTYTRR